MSTLITLTDAQWRLAKAVREKKSNPNLSVRSLSILHAVPRTTLQRACKTDGSDAAVLQLSDGRGCKQRLTEEEKALIVQAALEFQNNGTPLRRESLKDLATNLIQTLPAHRRQLFDFKDDRPGKGWIAQLLSRFPDLSLKTRANLGHDRAEAMTPESVATHFARVRALCEKYGIAKGSHIFNLDESGFSVRGMTLGSKRKCIVRGGTRANTRGVKFRGTVDHVTLMPVVSGAGQLLTPVVVLPGVNAKYRKLKGGGFQTPADFLPEPNYLFYRKIAWVDGDIFYSWALSFAEETHLLCKDGQKILLVFDGFAGHLTFRTLNLFKNNGIIVCRLPAHTSHVLQPLDVGVFGPFKEKFRQQLSARSVTSKKNDKSDIFTICELLKNAYYQTVTAANIIGGFQSTGLWVQSARGPDSTRIRAEDFTSSEISAALHAEIPSTRAGSSLIESSSRPAARLDSYRQLYDLFLSRSERLCSDGVVVTESGTIKVSMRSGATLTSDNVLSALKSAEAKRKANHASKAAAVEERARRQELAATRELAKRTELLERQQRREQAEEDHLHVTKEVRRPRRRRLEETRAARRDRAKRRCTTGGRTLGASCLQQKIIFFIAFMMA